MRGFSRGYGKRMQERQRGFARRHRRLTQGGKAQYGGADSIFLGRGDLFWRRASTGETLFWPSGDPRRGGVDWIDWVERIPFMETRSYVQRVLENAVVYEAMHPDRASYRGANPLSHFLGKPYPG